MQNMDIISSYTKNKNEYHIWKNMNNDKTLWNGHVFAFIGFKHPSYSRLLNQLLLLLWKDGGSFILEEYLDPSCSNQMDKISFYICNYSEGHGKRPIYAISGNSVTPLWLLICHQDQLKYTPSFHPFFQSNMSFNSYTHPFTSMCILLLGFKADKAPLGDLKYVRKISDKDIIKRFIILSGAKYQSDMDITDEELRAVTHIIVNKLTRRHQPIIKKIKNIGNPVVRLDWLFHAYLTGRFKVEGFDIDLDSITLKMNTKKPSIMATTFNPTENVESKLFENFIIYLSKNCPQSMILRCQEMGCRELHNLKYIEPQRFLKEFECSISNFHNKIIIIFSEDDLIPTIKKDYNKVNSEETNIVSTLNKAIRAHPWIICVTPLWLELCKKMKQIIEPTRENGGISLLNHTLNMENIFKDTRKHSLNSSHKSYPKKLNQIYQIAEDIHYGESEMSWSSI